MRISYYRLEEVTEKCHHCDGKGVIGTWYAWGDKLDEVDCGYCHGKKELTRTYRVAVWECEHCGAEGDDAFSCDCGEEEAC